jgi:hypothetical protein
MFAHYFDPHLAYSPPAPYDSLYFPDYEGRIGRSFNLEGFSRVRDSMFVQMRELDDADREQIVALYDGEIAFTDSAVGELLRGLDERGLSGNTLLVLLSDHGEEFFEHGGFEHGHTLYDELLHVPLILSLPGALPEGVGLKRQVRLLDVTPTVLDIAGIPLEPHFEGVSLEPVLTGKGSPSPLGSDLLPAEAAYAEAMMHVSEQKCLSVYPWKLISTLRTRTHQLYDLSEDPGEMVDLSKLAPGPLSDLENTMYGALFGISDTWYIELGTGDGTRTFDISIKAERGMMPGSITAHKILDASGRIAHDQEPFELLSSGAGLRLESFRLKGKATLAFKAEPERVPVEFDILIDGEPATEATFLGGDLIKPAGIPFVLKARRTKAASAGRPAGEISLPYALVWLEKSGYAGNTLLKLDEETKRELRSLGYIQ